MTDLRSDTVTKPGSAMLKAMTSAEVGDMVFGEDPSVNRLEELISELFGTEDAIFCPTGTMTNQIAVKVHTEPGDEIICSNKAHIYLNEGGGLAFHSGVQVALIDTPSGTFTAMQAEERINADDPHKARTRLVSVENTMNRGGGAVWENNELEKIALLCKQKGLKYHLDGARIFNACVKTGTKPSFYGNLFDSVSVCLSKGLGAPVGSLLTGNREFIYRARRLRKLMGGTMRQAGYLAAAGIYALKNNIDRLYEDHDNALMLKAALAECNWTENILPVDSNIVIFGIKPPHTPNKIRDLLKSEGILAGVSDSRNMRMVTHLDVTREMITEACTKIRKLTP